MVAREVANEKAGEIAVKRICTLISDANSDIQGKISCISKRQDNLDLANKTMNEKLDQISEKASESKTLLSSIQNQLQQQTAAQKKTMDKSFQSLQKVYGELAIHKSISSNQESTITDMKSQIQTLQIDLEQSRLDIARKEDLLKKLRLQPSPSTTSSTSKSNDPSNIDNTDKIPASPPQNASADAPKVTTTVPTNTTDGPNGISNSNNTNKTPVSAPLDAASADAQNTIATVSFALHTTNTSEDLQANPTIDSTSDSTQASTNVTPDGPNVTNTNPDLQADSTTNNTSVSSHTSRNLQANPTIDSTSDSTQASTNVTPDDLNVTNTNPDLQADSTTNNTSVSSQAPANAPQPNIENDPTTCPSATHNEASLLSDLPVTLDNLNVETIKAILSGKNLNPTGRKHDLVDRLRVHLAQHPNLPTPTV
eukprot:CAMPEP_0185791394 /NCGR_PEP_ID=MMETSP1174-20130828/158351_1 /TAXON_ID=35687 /ORGANISM="Dictyocha speculum, Strain CCMP1381" /LENGTH=424 /DNA_ID=CAMNT_0028486339 /DNA_START=765 /DNA_END=2039 /DNA_ORIENTATION=+